jgi:hypothetical protein
MRALGLVLVLAITGSSATARADDLAAEPRLVVGGSVAIWIPQSDADDFADVSLGVRPQVTYWITPLLGVTGSFDWVFVNEKSGTGAGSVTYYAISAGGRITLPRPARIKPYGEVMLGWHTLDGEGFGDSGLGFRLGGGATYALSQRLVASAGLGYSTASIDTGFFDITVAAFVLDLGLAARF